MAFATVLLAGGTAACGENSANDSAKEGRPEVAPAAAVAKAAKSSEDITSLHYRITGTVPDEGHVEAEASMRTEPPAMSMRMTTAGQGGKDPLEIRFVDEAMFVGGSAPGSEMSGGKGWSRVEPAVWGRGSVDNNSYGVLPSQLEGNPAVQSTLLTGSQDLQNKGRETIDGARTTHYRGTVTGSGLRAARDAADRTDRERRIDSLDQFVALHLADSLTMDLWIDDENHTKRFRMRGDGFDPRGGTQGGQLDLTVTLLDVNQPVSVEAPPSEDTVDAGALVDKLPAG
jgi:hypothetical protein